MDMPRGIGALSTWLDRVVNSVFEDALHKIQMDNDEEMAGLPPADAEMMVQERSLRIIHETARDFLRNWTYYSSQIMRELTVKSAPSFGRLATMKIKFDATFS